MALQKVQTERAKCPAADIQQPVLSPRPFDIECRIAGVLYPPGMKSCDGCYGECRIWKNAQIALGQNIQQSSRREFEGSRRAHHTLTSRDTEVVRG